MDNVRLIEDELERYSPTLASKPAWLALTKIDVLDAAARESVLATLRAEHPECEVFAVSAVTGEGIDPLITSLRQAVAERRAELAEDDAAAEAQARHEAAIQEEVLASALAARPPRLASAGDKLGDAGDAGGVADDDDDVEVVYVDE